MLRVLVAALAGAVVGGAVLHWAGALDRDLPAAEVALEAPAKSEAERSSASTSDLAEPSRAPVASSSERMPDALEPEVLISAALRRYADQGLRAGWKDLRADDISAEELTQGMASFETAVLALPKNLGRSAADRRNKADEALADARTGGVLALLAKLDGRGVGPLPELVRDPSQLEPLFQRSSAESARSALANREHPDADVADGVTLNWPAGVFTVKNLMKEKDPYPRDVTLAGAGIDATLLVLGDELSTRGSVRNFAIRDCTVHTNGNYLFDLRHVPAAMRFDRVRFVGFDKGAGGSCLLGTHTLALWARNCRFEGGYGRSPSSGTIFDVRTDGLIARFDACTFSFVRMNVNNLRTGATVLFAGCALERILDDPQGASSGHAGVLFDRCSITRFEGGPQDVPKLDLNTLFPDWRTRME